MNLSLMKKLAIIAAAAALALLFYLVWQSGLMGRLSDHDQLVEWMRRDGLRGPLLCIGIQFLQVVIFMIPGEITQIAAGYVFGAWLGFVYSVIGIALGSAFDYSVARLIGRPAMARILGPKRLRRMDAMLRSRKGRSALFVMFLLPGTPKDAMSYAAGLTNFRLVEFVAISALARMPALLLSTLFGAEAYSRNYTSMAVIAFAAVAGVIGFFLYQRRQALA